MLTDSRRGDVQLYTGASGGIRSLPLGKYEAHGIAYAFTNVAQDAHSYPVLHDRDGARSEPLDAHL